ncbi:MAG TPA: hypothetical protein PKY59_12160, partial [Pyrinomonadaceae bacterium]|nr:hypothetical protein [Pyrinomonadaceae bacterium]
AQTYAKPPQNCAKLPQTYIESAQTCAGLAQTYTESAQTYIESAQKINSRNTANFTFLKAER